MDEHTLILQKLLEKYIADEITKKEINTLLINEMDIELILDSNNSLMSDLYFSLLHYSIGEEGFTMSEAHYFLECLSGIRKHSYEDKFNNCYNKTTNI